MAETKKTVATDDAVVIGAYTPKHSVKQNTPVNLGEGQVEIASIRQSTSDNKIIAEFAEGLTNPQAASNVIAMLNESDSRFAATTTVRRVWQALEKADAHKLGITAVMITAAENAKSPDGDSLPVEVHIKMPTLIGKDGKKVPVVIESRDSIVPFDTYQAANVAKTAKQFVNKKTGEAQYFVKVDANGKYQPIFNHKRLVLATDRKDQIVNSDVRLTWDQIQSQGVIEVSYKQGLNSVAQAAEGEE